MPDNGERTFIDVLIPTCDRPESLLVCLASVIFQEYSQLRVVIAEQSEISLRMKREVLALERILRARGGELLWFHRPDRRGIAEQRDFLLSKASNDEVLFLDDDVLLEPQVVGHLHRTLSEHGCGFVGAFPSGLSFRDDIRPEQQRIEFWEGLVLPEAVEVGSPAWERLHLHRAANLWHVSRKLSSTPRPYKVAWVACCVLYDRRKLLDVGGFSFWRELPRYHSGEEVLVQNLLMRKWGGCALAPSGAYHVELPSTVLNERGSVDGHAMELLPAMLSRSE